MRMPYVLCLAILLLLSLPAFAMDLEELDNISYSVGYHLGKDLKENSVKPDIDKLLDGLFDASEKMEPQYPQKEMDKLLSIKKPEEEVAPKVNYAYGFRSGTLLSSAAVELRPEPLLFGVTDVADKKKPKFSAKEMKAYLDKLEEDAK